MVTPAQGLSEILIGEYIFIFPSRDLTVNSFSDS